MKNQETIILNEKGEKVATLKAKSIKGALAEIKRSSIAIPAGYKIIIEYQI